jgi:hypothetical protein
MCDLPTQFGVAIQKVLQGLRRGAPERENLRDESVREEESRQEAVIEGCFDKEDATTSRVSSCEYAAKDNQPPSSEK